LVKERTYVFFTFHLLMCHAWVEPCDNVYDNYVYVLALAYSCMLN